MKNFIAFYRHNDRFIFMPPALAATSLRSLLQARRIEMTPKHARIADFCLANPLAAGTMGLEELAEATGVSFATVNRFARALGLEGFADFRALAVADIHRMMSPEEKLKAQAANPQADIAIVEASMDAALFGLNRTRQALDAPSWALATQAIRSADRVFVVGFGISAFLADLLADMIVPFCQSQIVIDGRGGHEHILRRTFGVRAGDVVIAITLPRYSQAVLDHVGQMRAQGAKVLGITDRETSPLVPLCDVVLLASSQHPLLHASPTAVVAVFEALASLLTARVQNAGDAAELSRRIRPYLHAPEQQTIQSE